MVLQARHRARHRGTADWVTVGVVYSPGEAEAIVSRYDSGILEYRTVELTDGHPEFRLVVQPHPYWANPMYLHHGVVWAIRDLHTHTYSLAQRCLSEAHSAHTAAMAVCDCGAPPAPSALRAQAKRVMRKIERETFSAAWCTAARNWLTDHLAYPVPEIGGL